MPALVAFDIIKVKQASRTVSEAQRSDEVHIEQHAIVVHLASASLWRSTWTRSLRCASLPVLFYGRPTNYSKAKLTYRALPSTMTWMRKTDRPHSKGAARLSQFATALMKEWRRVALPKANANIILAGSG